MFLRTQTVGGLVYLLLVEDERVDGHVRQRVVQPFGQLEALRASGQLDAIVARLGRFSERLTVLGAVGRGAHVRSEAHRIGGPLVFQRLWEVAGLADVLREVARGRHFGFFVERAVFPTVLRRLLTPGSNRAADGRKVVEAQDNRGDNWYILGVRMRAVRAMRDLLVADNGSYQEVFPRTGHKKRPAPLRVRGVTLEDRDYALCLNEDETAKDRHDRDAIVAALRDALRQGDTALMGNRGHRRDLARRGHRFEIGEAKVLADARVDSKWVLSINTGLDRETRALAFKQLWTVESFFRSMRSVVETRPVYQKCVETIRDHVFCSFVALVLRRALEDRLAARHWKLEWHDVLQDLDWRRQVRPPALQSRRSSTCWGDRRLKRSAVP